MAPQFDISSLSLFTEPAWMKQVDQLKNSLVFSNPWAEQMEKLIQFRQPYLEVLEKHKSFMTLSEGLSQQFRQIAELRDSFRPFKVVEEMIAQQKMFAPLFDNIAQTRNQWAELVNVNSAFSQTSYAIARSLQTNPSTAWAKYLDSIVYETSRISDEITETEYITKADLEKMSLYFSMQLEAISQQVGKIGKDKIAQVIIWLNIISFILTVVSFALTIKNELLMLQTKESNINNQDIATKQDIEDLRTDIFKKLNNYNSQNQFKRNCIERKCTVYLKPTSHSLATASINPRDSILILQTVHKWVYISFIDASDTLAQTGWILKKYLQ